MKTLNKIILIVLLVAAYADISSMKQTNANTLANKTN